MTTDHAQEEAAKLAENFGAMFVRALQGDYDLVDYYAKEMQIDFKDCKPFLPAIHDAIRLAEKRGRATIEKELMAELRDPNGTIWEHAKRLQDENDALKSDRRRVLEEAKELLRQWKATEVYGTDIQYPYVWQRTTDFLKGYTHD